MHPDVEAHLIELKTRQKNLTTRRIALEKKQKMRDATMAEFSIAYTDMLKRKQRQHQQNEMIARKRNQQFLSTLYEYQKSMGDPVKSTSTIAVTLEKSKMEFTNKVMEVYPAWQEEQQRTKMQKLRQLEQEKHEIEYRRMLAKQNFEKEQGIDALLQQAANDINLVSSVERNETYARQLLRQQKLKKAMDLENAIHFHAEEERRRMEDNHFNTLTTPPVAEYEQLAVKYAAATAPIEKPKISSFNAEQPKPPIVQTIPNDTRSISVSNTLDQEFYLPSPSKAVFKMHSPSPAPAQVIMSLKSSGEPIIEPTESCIAQQKDAEEVDDILNDFRQMVPLPQAQPVPAPREAQMVTIHTNPVVLSKVVAPLETPQTLDHTVKGNLEVPKKVSTSNSPVNTLQENRELVESSLTVDDTLATIPCAVDMIKKPKTPSPRHSPELHSQVPTLKIVGEELNLIDEPQEIVSNPPQQLPQDVSPRISDEVAQTKLSAILNEPESTTAEISSTLDQETTLLAPSTEPLTIKTEEMIIDTQAIDEPAEKVAELNQVEKGADLSPPQTPVQPVEFNLPDPLPSPPPKEDFEFLTPPQTKASPREASPVRAAEAVLDVLTEVGSLQLQLETSTDIISSIESPIPQRTSAFPESPTYSLNDSVEVKGLESPLPSPIHEEEMTGTVTAKLNDMERLSLMTNLMQRIEESAKTEGFTARVETIELQAAKSGRQAQINVFGADVCFALLLDGLRDVGPYLFTEDLMVGKMTSQRLTKAYQANRNKEKDYWKLFTSHLTQLINHHAISSTDAAHIFSTVFMDQMPKDDRTARKLRELLISLCPTVESKESNPEKPKEIVNIPTKEVANVPKIVKNTEEPFSEAKSILGLAFMRQNSSAKRVQDPLVGRGKSLSNTSIGQRVLRGASLRDYSDFEDDEDEVNYSSASTVNTIVASKNARPSQIKITSSSHDDDFDENF
ncbi:hypothetical protein THRCLA_04240 [Thraustotheca clavata]|uniref:Uncharacterized protein n=1 Tax=Thraustotheca clavata TaxID=74557 RepID=A0A1V9ZZM7_9STRA|nr:hypothetical protein THRCLA_04240 [Thraustotheca clavata]